MAVLTGGHALVALMTAGADPIHKATIMPRGRALGMVMQLPKDDQTSVSRQQVHCRDTSILPHAPTAVPSYPVYYLLPVRPLFSSFSYYPCALNGSVISLDAPTDGTPPAICTAQL
jgi:Peptidase family M41